MLRLQLLLMHCLTSVCLINSFYHSQRRILSSVRQPILAKMSSMSNSELNPTQGVSANSIDRLLKQTNTWCGVNGLMYTDGKVTWTPAPLSLIPNVFSAKSFLYAFKVQPIINKLVDAISRDREFLLDKLSSVSESDEFTKRILELYKLVPDEIVEHGLQCGILRSDYMINNDNRALQVEINTIASSFGFLSKKVSDYHRYILERNAHDADLHTIIQATIGAGITQNVIAQVTAKNVQENPSSVQLAAVLALAHQQCKEEHAAVLFIVQPGERNQADQRAFEAQLWTAHHIPCEFLTLQEVHERGRVAPGAFGTNKLTIGPARGTVGSEFTVSVAYFRAGYTPNDYPTEHEWAARALIERSSAIKCPNTGYQLTGTKAIQASLCLPGVLERFLTVEESALLRRCFAAQYSLVALTDHSAEGAELRADTARAVAAATADGAPWVLKPQREGGGNNLYGKELSAFLLEHAGSSTLSGYVLMQRIFPLPQKTAFLRSGALQILPSISELGVYGTFLGYGPNSPVVGRSHNLAESAEIYPVFHSGNADPELPAALHSHTHHSHSQSHGHDQETGKHPRSRSNSQHTLVQSRESLDFGQAFNSVAVDARTADKAAALAAGQVWHEGVLNNAYGGYLLRTKPDGVDEGGVASGYSVLNSVILE